MHRHRPWAAVDAFFAQRLQHANASEAESAWAQALSRALAASDAGRLPSHNVAPNQGKLLSMLVELGRATSVLEVGTLAGYSTMWLSRGVQRNGGGSVVSLELDQERAALARSNLARARPLLDKVKVEVREGAALESLPRLSAEGRRFDFVFVDADKKSNTTYVDWAVKMSRPGTLIVVDNVVREGHVVDEASRDESVLGVRNLVDYLSRNGHRLDSCALQTVGSKGWDGFIAVRVER